MLKRMFALSDQGSKDLNKGIAATTLSNLCLIAPVSLLVMVIWELLNVISGQETRMQEHTVLFIVGTVLMFVIVFLTQWLQYNKTYTVAYEESANRRIVLAEKIKKITLIFLWPKRSFGSDNNDYGGLHSTGTGIFQCHSPAFWNNFYVYYYSDRTFGHGLENGTFASCFRFL